MIGLQHFLLLGAILFAIGFIGAFIGRNRISQFLSIQIILAAVNINITAFSKYGFVDRQGGHLFIIIISIVSALQIVAGIFMSLTNDAREGRLSQDD